MTTRFIPGGDLSGGRDAAWPLVLLMAFLLVIRLVPTLTRPAAPADDCSHVSKSDVAALERCLVIRPDDVELMVDLADSLERAGESGRAVSVLRRALDVDPGDGEILRRLERLTVTQTGGD